MSQLSGQKCAVRSLAEAKESVNGVNPGCVQVLPGWKMPAPLFLVPGAPGKSSYLSALSAQLGSDRAVIGFRSSGMDRGSVPLVSVQDMAAHFLEEILLIQPQGPYLLAGHSFGGLVAYEIAQQLRDIGGRVAHLFLLDTAFPQEILLHKDESPDVMANHELSKFHAIFTPNTDSSIATHLPDAKVRQVYLANMAALVAYRPRPLNVPITLMRALDGFPLGVMHSARTSWENDKPGFGWSELCPQLMLVEVPGNHLTMLLPPQVQVLGANLRALLVDAHSIPWRVATNTGEREPAAVSPVQVMGKNAILNCWNSAFVANPHSALRRLQDEFPICRNTCGHHWLTRYEDVSFVLKDPRFSSALLRVDRSRSAVNGLSSPAPFRLSKSTAMLFKGFMMLSEGDAHLRMKRHFAPFFRPAALERWSAKVSELVTDAVSSMGRRAVADIIADVAEPVPALAIAEIMGLPHDDVPRLTRWARDVGSLLDLSAFHDPVLASTSLEALQGGYEHSARELSVYMREHIERSRSDRKSDEYLLRPRTFLDQGFGIDELVAQYVFIFLAGFVTTSNTIGNAMLSLMRNPDQRTLWRDHPELTSSAVEEMLRFDGGASSVLRFAREEVEIRGQRIGKGERVVLSLAAANRDPRVFPDPDRLDITRDAGRHLAFIQGAHSCLGVQLARMQLRLVLPSLISLDLELIPGSIQWRQGTFFRGMTQMQVRQQASPY